MRKIHEFSRREFLRLSAMASAGAVAARLPFAVSAQTAYTDSPALADAGLPLLRVDVQKEYDLEELRQTIQQQIA